jgi:hypothetical protein
MGSLFADPVLLATVLGTNLPFLSMVAILIFTRSNPGLSSKISVGAMVTAAVCSIFLLVKLYSASPIQYQTLWLSSDKLNIAFSYYLDPPAHADYCGRHCLSGADLLAGIYGGGSRI